MNAIFVSILILTSLLSVDAQNWPDKIRGYKVYDAKVTVTNGVFKRSSADQSDAHVKLRDPTLADFGFTRAFIEIGAEVTSSKQNGQVEFVTFHDVMVNGFKVDIEEYRHPFDFKKGEPVSLPKPARIELRIASIPRAIYKELFERKSELIVTGTAFVFGKFRKLGFGFKRVVPVKMDLRIRNPLR